MAPALDTQAAVQDLVNVGVQAEAAQAIIQAFVRMESGLASKTDLHTLAVRLDAKIDTAATDLNAKIDTTATDLNAKIEASAAELNGKIDRVASDIDQKLVVVGKDLTRMENRLLTWAVVLGFGFTGLLFAVLRFT